MGDYLACNEENVFALGLSSTSIVCESVWPASNCRLPAGLEDVKVLQQDNECVCTLHLQDAADGFHSSNKISRNL